jgi:alpha-beta hydrolase superfamily lysophospholipase
MSFLLMILGALVGAGLVLTFVLALLWRPLRWRRLLWTNLILLPFHALLFLPLVLGWFGSRSIGTRQDERAYGGPRFDQDGKWLFQSRASLRGAGSRPALGVEPPVEVLRLPSSDGVVLRAFFVPAARKPLGVAAVLVHGLFRGALELEQVGSMLRDLGVDLVMLEMRNHGGSGRAPATYGLREADDVRAAAAFVRQDPRTRNHKLVVFGVSLGSVAVMLAVPEVQGLAGVMLDAPVTDLTATAHRMLSARRDKEPRRPGIPEPIRSIALRSIELWSGFSFAEIQPAVALRRLPPEVPLLLVAEGDDDRIPPEEVAALLAALPGRDPARDLWTVPDAGHGTAWESHPQEYRQRVQGFIERVLAR